jgi:hypothetical protein
MLLVEVPYIVQYGEDGPVKIGSFDDEESMHSEVLFKIQEDCGRPVTKYSFGKATVKYFEIVQEVQRKFKGRRAFGDWFSVGFEEAVDALESAYMGVQGLPAFGLGKEKTTEEAN